MRCSAKTAPANRRWSRSSTASFGPTPARYAGTGEEGRHRQPGEGARWGSAWCSSSSRCSRRSPSRKTCTGAGQEPRRTRELDDADRETSTRYGLALDPRRHIHAVGRRASARRDRALPSARPRAADHGRADVGADAGGDRHAVRHSGAWPTKAARSSTSVTSSTRSAPCATARLSCAPDESPAIAIRAGRAAPILRA